MDGVTILNDYMTYSDGWAAILTVGIMGGLFLIVFAIHLISDGAIFTGFVIAILILLIVIGCMGIPKTTYYEAVIDSSISWKELIEKYKVVKIKGQIITLVEIQGE